MKPSPELAALFTPVLAWLDAGGDDMKLDMSYFYRSSEETNGCGTTACLAGAVGIFNPDLNYSGVTEAKTTWTRAAYANNALVENYGMDLEDMERMFLENMIATPSQAAATVRNWIETGEVQW